MSVEVAGSGTMAGSVPATCGVGAGVAGGIRSGAGPAAGIWAGPAGLSRCVGPTKADRAEAKRLTKEIRAAAAELAKLYANPKGPGGTFTARQMKRIEALERKMQALMDRLAQLNGPVALQNEPTTGGTPQAGAPDTSAPSSSSEPSTPPVDSPANSGGSVWDRLTSGLANRATKIEGEIETLQGQGELTPQDEAKLQKLLRDYQRITNLMDQVNTFLTNMEKSRHEARMAVLRNFA